MMISKRKIVIYLVYILAAIPFYLGAKDGANSDIYFITGGGLIGLSHMINKYHFGKRKIEKNVYDDARAQDK